jgi:branched-chain amino acid transport system permease protein
MRIGVFHQTYSAEEQLLDSRTQRAWMLAFVVAVLGLPWYGSDYVLTLACIAGIHVVATIGMNIITGSAGLICLSHAAFMGVGAYTVGWLGRHDVPFVVALPAAGVLTALTGVFVGLPSLRVKGLYFAIATLSAQFILTFVFREWEPVTGGVTGTSIARARLLGLTLGTNRAMFYLISGSAFALGLGARNLARSYVGRAFVALRDRDISAEILGLNLLRYKLLAFAIGSFYAGVAGGLLGYYYGATTPEYFGFSLSVFYLAAIIVGGLGTVLGSVLGALFMTLVPEMLRVVANAGSAWLPRLTSLLLPLGQVVFGFLIIAFLIFEPLGLVQGWNRIRRTFHLWPFKT